MWSELCSPSSRARWTSLTQSARRPVSSSCPNWWSCGVSLQACEPVLERVLCSHPWCCAGGKDGMVGFPDFIYKHIVPACFLAPLKPTFDLADAQTVLVSQQRVPFQREKQRRTQRETLRHTVKCLLDAVGVCRHAQNDSSQEGKTQKFCVEIFRPHSAAT